MRSGISGAGYSATSAEHVVQWSQRPLFPLSVSVSVSVSLTTDILSHSLSDFFSLCLCHTLCLCPRLSLSHPLFLCMSLSFSHTLTCTHTAEDVWSQFNSKCRFGRFAFCFSSHQRVSLLSLPRSSAAVPPTPPNPAGIPSHFWEPAGPAVKPTQMGPKHRSGRCPHSRNAHLKHENPCRLFGPMI